LALHVENLKSLVADSRAGDLDAYGRIVVRFRDMAYGYAYSILGDFHLAEDAAQEAFIEAYRCLANLRDADAFPGWFRRIVLKHCDRPMRRKRLSTVSLDAAATIAAGDQEPPQAAEEREMAAKVLEAIGSLSTNERTVTTLFYINGYSQADIAAFLEVPAGTVKSRLHASRKCLKERMMDMVTDELQSHVLSDEFPERIRMLLELPRPLEISDHPVRQAWEAFRSCFNDLECVVIDEVHERSVSHIPASLLPGVAHEIDDLRMLRTDLTAGLRDLWLTRGGGPCRLVATGRTFRKGYSKASHVHAEAFHQAEVLWCEQGLDERTAVETAERVAKAVLGDVKMRMSEPVDVGAGVQACELSGGWQNGWLEFGVSGLHPRELVARAGLDPDQFGAVCLAFGLDRCAQIRYEIDDIRKLWQPPYVPQ